jgi:hypothetical protein
VPGNGRRAEELVEVLLPHLVGVLLLLPKVVDKR